MDQKKVDEINQKLRKKINIDYLKLDFELAKPKYIEKNERLRRYIMIYDDASSSSPNTTLSKTEQSKYKSYIFKKACLKLIPEIQIPIVMPVRLFNLSHIGVNNLESNKSDIAEDLLNYQWNSLLDKKNLVEEAATKFIKEGTAILKVGWDINVERKKIEMKTIKYAQSEEEANMAILEAEKLDDNMATVESMKRIYEKEGKMPIGYETSYEYKNVVLDNKPQVKVVNNFAFMVDPFCGSKLSNASFVIEPYLVTLSKLKKNKDRYFNLDKINLYEDSFDQDVTRELDTSYRDDGKYERAYDFSDNFEQSERKQRVMYEYWGYTDLDDDSIEVPFVASWIGDTLIRLEHNPYPHGKIPYCMSSYSDVEDVPFGESLADLIQFDQSGSTLSHRAMENIAIKNVEQQDFIDSRLLTDATQRKNFRDGNPVFYNGRGVQNARDAFWTKTSEPVPNVLFDMKNLYSDSASSTADVNLGAPEYVQDGFGANVPADATSDQKLRVLSKFTMLFEEMARIIMPLNARYSFAGDNYKTDMGVWKKISSTQALKGKRHCEIEVSTPEMRLAKATRLMSLMSSRGSNMSEDVQAVYHMRIGKLLDETEMAKMINDLTVNREPTEFEQEMQQLDIEMKKAELEAKKAEAQYHLGRYEENITRAMERLDALEIGMSQAIKDSTMSKSEVQLSEADMYDAKTKLFNNEFNYKASGEEREDKEIESQFQHLANLEREKVRTERELSLMKKKDENGDGKVTKDESKNYLLNLIHDKTLKNDSYDEAGHVARNIDTMNY